MTSFKGFFSNNSLADEEKNRKNRILYVLWLSYWIFFTILLVLGFFLSKNFLGVVIFYILTSISLFIVGLLKYYEFTDQASVGFVTFNWLLMSIFAYVSGGYLNIIASFFIALIVIAGVLIDYRASLGVLVASFLSAFFYIILNSNNTLPVLFKPSILNNWLLFAFIGLLVLVPIYLNSRSLNSSLTDAKNNAIKYKDLSDSLDKVVKERTKELEETNKDLKSFTYAISHEFNAPLNIINNNIALLSEEMDNLSSDEINLAINKIKNSSSQMSNLFDDLLKFFKLTKQPLTKTPINMNNLVKRALESFEIDIQKRNVHIALQELNPCLGDENLIFQVWINLISNSLKYSRNKSDVIIEIYQEKGKKECTYFIKDNGIGFDMDKANDLFNEFQRLDNTFEGTGLGLALCKRILEAHGGEISFQSKMNEGSIFSFSIPT